MADDHIGALEIPENNISTQKQADDTVWTLKLADKSARNDKSKIEMIFSSA